MILKKLFFPGKFDDAYLYMGWLHLVTCERSLISMEVSELAAVIDKHVVPEAKGLAAYLFARNDWLSSESFRALMSNKEMSTAFRKMVDAMPDALEVQWTHFDLPNTSTSSLSVGAGDFVDMRFYGQRLYVGTTEGLWDLDVEWKKELSFDRAKKRLDSSCMSISAGFGTVNASCGKDGLFTFTNDLNQVAAATTLPIQQQATSLRTGWHGYDIVSYVGGGDANLYITEQEKVSNGQNRETTIVIGVRDRKDFVPASAFGEGELARENIRFMFHSSHAIYVQSFSGQLLQWTLARNTTEPNIKNTVHRESVAPILSGTAIRHGLVLETLDAILLARLESSTIQLLDRSAISSRTFSVSKRFKELVAITAEDGVWLISIVDHEEVK